MSATQQQQQQSSWQTWDASGEEDSWEDVTEVATAATTGTSITTPEKQNVSSTNSMASVTPSIFEINRKLFNSLATPTAQLTTSSDETTTELQRHVVLLQSHLQTALDRASAAERKCIAVSRSRPTLTNADLELKLAAALSEGEKLSVRIAEKEQTTRTLKSSFKQKDMQIQDLQLTISAIGAKLEASSSKLKQLETNEKAALDSRAGAERRLRELENEMRGNKSSSAAVETLRSQLENLRKSQQENLDTQAMRSMAEKENGINKEKEKYKIREIEIEKTINEMRQHLNQMISNSQWKEDNLIKENKELRNRFQLIETRNQELNESLQDITKPLIKQIESLQNASIEKENNKIVAERMNMKRIRTAEKVAEECKQREQMAEEKISELLAKIAGLEERIRVSARDIKMGVEEIERVKDECEEKETRAKQQVKGSEERIKKYEQLVEEIRNENKGSRKLMVETLESNEQRERELRSMLAEAESKIAMTIERERQLNRKQLSSSSTSTSSSSGISSRQQRKWDDGGDQGVYERERLSTSLKLRRGEVENLQSQLESKEKATRALAEEVVNLTCRLEILEKEGKGNEGDENKLQALSKRHETLLELLGEREERIGELEADLSDVKAMYKDQVTELLLRIERLNA